MYLRSKIQQIRDRVYICEGFKYCLRDGVVFLLHNSCFFSHFSTLRFVLQNTMSERQHQQKNTHPSKNNGTYKNEGKRISILSLKITC